MNALAFSSTNFLFSKLMDHGEKERKIHDVALEKLQRARDEWNDDLTKILDFINERVSEQNEARAYINYVDEAMFEYYRVFAKQTKSFPPEPQLSDFCHHQNLKKLVNYCWIRWVQIWQHILFPST